MGAIYRGANHIKIESLNQVKANRCLCFKAGICGTDMHLYHEDWKWMKKGRIIGHDALESRTPATRSHGSRS
jgi:hypothetical protein